MILGMDCWVTLYHIPIMYIYIYCIYIYIPFINHHESPKKSPTGLAWTCPRRSACILRTWRGVSALHGEWIGLREHLQERPYISWENPWFPVEFPLHHFVDMEFRSLFAGWWQKGTRMPKIGKTNDEIVNTLVNQVLEMTREYKGHDGLDL